MPAPLPDHENCIFWKELLFNFSHELLPVSFCRAVQKELHMPLFSRICYLLF